MNSSPRTLKLRKAARSRRSGQSLVEYGLMLAFIVLVAIGILSATGQSIKSLLGSINAQLQVALGSKVAPSSPSN
jgi:Flp pilus assembly pilin Flp